MRANEQLVGAWALASYKEDKVVLWVHDAKSSLNMASDFLIFLCGVTLGRGPGLAGFPWHCGWAGVDRWPEGHWGRNDVSCLSLPCLIWANYLLTRAIKISGSRKYLQREKHEKLQFNQFTSTIEWDKSNERDCQYCLFVRAWPQTIKSGCWVRVAIGNGGWAQLPVQKQGVCLPTCCFSLFMQFFSCNQKKEAIKDLFLLWCENVSMFKYACLGGSRFVCFAYLRGRQYIVGVHSEEVSKRYDGRLFQKAQEQSP